MHSNTAGIGRVFTQFYSQLFTSTQPSNIDLCLNDLAPNISPKMNSDLLRPFTMNEVERIIFQMESYKAPVPDGYSTCFYQNYWGVVSAEVARLSFLFSTQMLI